MSLLFKLIISKLNFIAFYVKLNDSTQKWFYTNEKNEKLEINQNLRVLSILKYI